MSTSTIVTINPTLTGTFVATQPWVMSALVPLTSSMSPAQHQAVSIIMVVTSNSVLTVCSTPKSASSTMTSALRTFPRQMVRCFAWILTVLSPLTIPSATSYMLGVYATPLGSTLIPLTTGSSQPKPD